MYKFQLLHYNNIEIGCGNNEWLNIMIGKKGGSRYQLLNNICNLLPGVKPEKI